jgi:hypothetical protein
MRGSRPSGAPRTQFVCMAGRTLLEVEGLEAKVAATGKQILKGVTLTIREGEVCYP